MALFNLSCKGDEGGKKEKDSLFPVGRPDRKGEMSCRAKEKEKGGEEMPSSTISSRT